MSSSVIKRFRDYIPEARTTIDYVTYVGMKQTLKTIPAIRNPSPQELIRTLMKTGNESLRFVMIENSKHLIAWDARLPVIHASVLEAMDLDSDTASSTKAITGYIIFNGDTKEDQKYRIRVYENPPGGSYIATFKKNPTFSRWMSPKQYPDTELAFENVYGNANNPLRESSSRETLMAIPELGYSNKPIELDGWINPTATEILANIKNEHLRHTRMKKKMRQLRFIVSHKGNRLTVWSAAGNFIHTEVNRGEELGNLGRDASFGMFLWDDASDTLHIETNAFLGDNHKKLFDNNATLQRLKKMKNTKWHNKRKTF